MVNSFQENILISRKKIILTYFIVNMIFSILVYFLIPHIMNYDVETTNVKLYVKNYKILYNQIFTLGLIVVNIMGLVFIGILFKNIENLVLNKKKIAKAKELCIKSPYIINILQTIFPSIILMIILPILTSFSWISIINQGLLLFTLSILGSQVTMIFTKTVFQNLLLKEFSTVHIKNNSIVTIIDKFIIHLIPILMASIILIYLIGYSSIYNEKSSLIFNYYKIQLDKIVSNSTDIITIDELSNKLNIRNEDRNKIIIFAMSQDEEIITSDEFKLDRNSIKYIEYFKKQSNYKNSEFLKKTHLAISNYNYNNQTYIIGVKYVIDMGRTLAIYLSSFLGFLILSVIIVRYFSKSLSTEILMISEKLYDISSNKLIDYNNRLPITSNDELMDLILAFNKILDMEKENLDKLQKSNKIIIEQERLSSLGKLVAGMAHNITIPIMSIEGVTYVINQLIQEYKYSLSNPKMTIEDHEKISDEIIDWAGKIRTHCTYISDIIRIVKGQIVSTSSRTDESFTINELIDRINILMKYELDVSNCLLSVENNLSYDYKIKGELSALVQVLNNLIQNSINSYEGKGGIITLNIKYIENCFNFSVSDQGVGMSEDVKSKIFKQIYTNKGESRMGIGLYISNSIIIGKFSGEMWVESISNKGTTFYISIPQNKNI